MYPAAGTAIILPPHSHFKIEEQYLPAHPCVDIFDVCLDLTFSPERPGADVTIELEPLQEIISFVFKGFCNLF